jgi:hypothetical protein
MMAATGGDEGMRHEKAAPPPARGQAAGNRLNSGFAAVLAGSGANESGVAEDAVGRTFADRQLEHVHQAAGPEAGCLLARGDDGPRGLWVGFFGCAWGRREWLASVSSPASQRRSQVRTVLRAHS